MEGAPLYSAQADLLFAPEILEEPDRLFAVLRTDRPVSRVGDTGVHLVASWDLVDEALAREEDFSANLTGVLMRGARSEPDVLTLPSNGVNHVIATADEPDHGVHRSLVQPPARAQHLRATPRPAPAGRRGDALGGLVYAASEGL